MRNEAVREGSDTIQLLKQMFPVNQKKVDQYIHHKLMEVMPDELLQKTARAV